VIIGLLEKQESIAVRFFWTAKCSIRLPPSEIALCTCAITFTEITDLRTSKAESPIAIGGGSGGVALVYSVRFDF